MNLRRIFANAIARRVAYVVVAIALAWLGVGGEARAQAAGSCPDFATGCTIEEAKLACDAWIAAGPYASSRPVAHVCVLTQNPGVTAGSWRGRYCYNHTTSQCTNHDAFFTTGCPAGYTWDSNTNSCNQPCSGKQPISSEAANAPGDSHSFCQDGCAYSCSGSSLLLTIDGQSRTVCAASWTTSGSATCTVAETPEPIAPVTDSDGDGASDENDLSPNNPGESGDGSGQDDSRACGGPGQPECSPDGSNEGSGKGNTSGGGGNCQTPPRSSGDAILAQIAFQTWATRCAIEGNANAGTGTGTDPGSGGQQGQPDWTKGDGPAVPTDDTDYVSDQTRFGLGVSPDLLDEENIFGNSACAHFSITVWSQTVSTADFDGWCNLVTILRGLILIFGAYSALQILMGRGLV